MSNAVPRANVTNPPTEVPKETQVAPTAEGEKVPVEPEVKESEKDVPSEEDPEEEEDNYGDDEEDYIEEEEEEEEDWLSDDDSPRAPKHGKRNETHNSDDEDYAHSKRRKVEVVKRPPRRNLTANESVGMKALRTYTTALKLGPRCFRNLSKIEDPREREMELIKRLHNLGRSWAGVYPNEEEIMLAREETIMKKEEKAREFIIADESGGRSTRKAAQKAMEF